MELKPGSIDYAQWIASMNKSTLQHKTKAQAFGYRPLISVVMPVYNGRNQMARKKVSIL